MRSPVHVLFVEEQACDPVRSSTRPDLPSVRQRRPCSVAHGAAPRICLRSSRRPVASEERPVTLGTILLIILVLMLIGAIPRWSHSRNWGYGPSGGLGLVLVVVVALLLMGRL